MIYFDNCATTKASKASIEEFVRVNEELYGNPNSLNLSGVWAENYVLECKKTIGNILGVSDKEIIFTSSATESNNMIIQGVANWQKNKRNHLITQRSEHPSVIEVYRHLEKNGFDVTYLDVNEYGQINIQDLKDAITEKTALVSIMHVHNETGSIFPIEEIGNAIKSVNEDTLFHVDAVQGFAKYKLNLKNAKVDFYTFSSHKIHGVKGVGRGKIHIFNIFLNSLVLR